MPTKTIKTMATPIQTYGSGPDPGSGEGLVLGIVGGLVLGIVEGLVLGIVEGLVLGIAEGLVLGIAEGLVLGIAVPHRPLWSLHTKQRTWFTKRMSHETTKKGSNFHKFRI